MSDGSTLLLIQPVKQTNFFFIFRREREDNDADFIFKSVSNKRSTSEGLLLAAARRVQISPHGRECEQTAATQQVGAWSEAAACKTAATKSFKKTRENERLEKYITS